MAKFSTDQMHRLRKSLARIGLDDFAESKPSEITDVYWICAKNKTKNCPVVTERSGKWLLFVDVQVIDDVWMKIKQATEDGRLGQDAKVATAKPSPNEVDRRKRVICVYTYDWTDEEDVRRVREELRTLGFTEKIPYKSDEDTLKGRYITRGHTKVSKYYE